MRNEILIYAIASIFLAISASAVSAQTTIEPIACSENCLSNPCSDYLDCTAIKGYCKTGYCCSGICLEPKPVICQGTCMADSCYQYDDCKPVNGVCETGNCCEGTCKVIPNSSDEKVNYISDQLVDVKEKLDDMSAINRFISEMYKQMKKPYIKNLHGTQYEPNDDVKIFLQLLDADNQPIDDTNSSCWVSIYYPNNIIWKYKQIMSYIDEGLWAYDTKAPYESGVYPVAALCTIPNAISFVIKTVRDNFECGSASCGTGWADDWTLNGAVIGSESHTGSYGLNLVDDNTPERYFEGNDTSEELDIEFWYKADSLDNSVEWFKVFVDDADGTPFELLHVTDEDDDNVWKKYTGTLYRDVDNFNMTGNITFRINTSGNLNTQDFFDIDDIIIQLRKQRLLNDTEYQIIRASGEVRITDGGKFVISIDNTSIIKDTVFYGYVYVNYSVYSKTLANVSDVDIKINLPYGFTCGTVEAVYDEDGNSLDFTTENYLTDESCTVVFDMDLEPLQVYPISVKMKNIWKKEHFITYNAEYVKYQTISFICQDYQQNNGLPSYEIPLVTVPDSGDALYDACNYYLDLWHYYNLTFEDINQSFYNVYSTKDFNTLASKMPIMDKLEDMLKETSYSIIERMSVISDYSIYLDNLRPYLTNSAKYAINRSATYNLYRWLIENVSTKEQVSNMNVSISNLIISTFNTLNSQNSQIISLIQGLANITASDVWSYYNRTLTFYNQTQIWNEFNTVKSNQNNIVMQIGNVPSNVWSYSNRSLTDYNQTQIWSRFDTIESQNTNIINLINALNDISVADVWSYTGNVNSILLNRFSQAIWNYTARYTHGIII